jgi:hypothetical protein
MVVGLLATLATSNGCRWVGIVVGRLLGRRSRVAGTAASSTKQFGRHDLLSRDSNMMVVIIILMNVFHPRAITPLQELDAVSSDDVTSCLLTGPSCE